MKRIVVAGAALFIIVVFVQQHAPVWRAYVKIPLMRPAAAPAQPELPEADRTGETMVFDVMFGKIKIGTSVYRRMQDRDLDGRRLQVRTFETDCARLKDREEIYSDPATFLPVRVNRQISSMMLKEQIVEEYDQEQFVLTITKDKPGTRPEVIRRDNPLQHPILLPHYIRDLPELKVGQVFQVDLPGRSFSVALKGIEDVTVPMGSFRSYRFESTPRQIVIWISADELRLPLKIQGIGIMNYILQLREHGMQKDLS
jgi:hypothetical protein